MPQQHSVGPLRIHSSSSIWAPRSVSDHWGEAIERCGLEGDKDSSAMLVLGLVEKDKAGVLNTQSTCQEHQARHLIFWIFQWVHDKNENVDMAGALTHLQAMSLQLK